MLDRFPLEVQPQQLRIRLQKERWKNAKRKRYSDEPVIQVRGGINGGAIGSIANSTGGATCGSMNSCKPTSPGCSILGIAGWVFSALGTLLGTGFQEGLSNGCALGSSGRGLSIMPKVSWPKMSKLSRKDKFVLRLSSPIFPWLIGMLLSIAGVLLDSKVCFSLGRIVFIPGFILVFVLVSLPALIKQIIFDVNQWKTAKKEKTNRLDLNLRSDLVRPIRNRDDTVLSTADIRLDRCPSELPPESDHKTPRLMWRDCHGVAFFAIFLFDIIFGVIGLVFSLVVPGLYGYSNISDINFCVSIISFFLLVGLLVLPLYQTVEFIPSIKQVRITIGWLFVKFTKVRDFGEITDVKPSKAASGLPQSHITLRFADGTEWQFNVHHFRLHLVDVEQVRTILGLREND